MPDTTVIPIRASTQEHLDIFDIQDDLVITKDGSCSLILQVTAINFGLLSSSEQDAIIYAYAGLLNSLNYPIQLIIHSDIKDITQYIRLLREQETHQKNQLLLNQLIKYREFVERTVHENRVLDKKFYVAIPFSSVELGLSKSVVATFQKRAQKPSYPIHYILERAKFALTPKRDQLINQFSRIGLHSRQLITQELLEVFYKLYNREAVGQKFVNTKEYTAPIVNSAKLGQSSAPAMKRSTVNASNVPGATSVFTQKTFENPMDKMPVTPAVNQPVAQTQQQIVNTQAGNPNAQQTAQGQVIYKNQTV